MKMAHLRWKKVTNPENRHDSEEEYVEEIMQEVKTFYSDLYAERKTNPVYEEIVSA